MGKCAKTKGKARKIECYVRSSAKWTAGKLKSGVERIGSFSGEQGSKHKYAFGLFFLAVILISVTGGAVFLLTSPISNPTAAEATYTRTYTLSDGTVVSENGQISGILKCVVQPSAGAITESSTWVVIGLGYWRTSRVTPYWIQNIWLKVFSGTSASGAPVVTIGLAVGSTTYMNTMQTWATNYWNTIAADAFTTTWRLGETPTDNPTWSATLDTRSLPNGVYTFQVVVAWGLGIGIPSTVTSMVTGIPVLPPSLGSSGGEARVLSMFGIGVDVPTELQMPIVFIIVIVIAVAVVLCLKRRG